MNKLVKLFAFAAVTMFAVACGQTTPVVDEAAVEQAKQDSIAAAAQTVTETVTAVGDTTAAAVGAAVEGAAAAVEGAAAAAGDAAKKVEEAAKGH